jgi:hypothetical protein
MLQDRVLAGEAVMKYLYDRVYRTPLVRPVIGWDRYVPVPVLPAVRKKALLLPVLPVVNPMLVGGGLEPYLVVYQAPMPISKLPLGMRLTPLAVQVGAGATVEVTTVVCRGSVVVVATVPDLIVAIVVVEVVEVSVTGVAWRLQAAEMALAAKVVRAVGVAGLSTSRFRGAWVTVVVVVVTGEMVVTIVVAGTVVNSVAMTVETGATYPRRVEQNGCRDEAIIADFAAATSQGSLGLPGSVVLE